MFHHDMGPGRASAPLQTDTLDHAAGVRYAARGHESIYFFSLIVLPIFAVNSVGFNSERAKHHWYVLGTGALMLLVYPIGTPLLYAFLMWRHRNLLMRLSRAEDLHES